MGLHLYELGQNYRDLSDLLDQAGGPDEEAAIAAKLAALTDDIEVKADRIAAIITELWAEAEAVKGEVERLQARKAALDHNADRLIAYVKRELELCKLERVKGPRFSLLIQKNPPKVIIDDESKIPGSYFREVMERKLDKATLLSDLKVPDRVIPGAHVEQETSLRLR